MADREKVIKGLRSQLDDLQKYADADEVLTLTQDQAKDILILLKEQEAKPIRGFTDTVEGVVIGNCSRCNRLIVGKENDPTWFCKYCGQAVKWE